MRRSIQTRKNFSLPRAYILLIPVLLFFGCSDSDNGPASGKADLSRPWIHEKEFIQNPFLKADPTQVIILDVTPGESDIRHSIPYEFTTSDAYRLCLSNDEEYITSVTLKDSLSTVIAHVDMNTPCMVFSADPGYYTMIVVHDGTTVVGEPKPGFITLVNKNPPASDMAGERSMETANFPIKTQNGIDSNAAFIFKLKGTGKFVQLEKTTTELENLCYSKKYGDENNMLWQPYIDTFCPSGNLKNFYNSGAEAIDVYKLSNGSDNISKLFKFELAPGGGLLAKVYVLTEGSINPMMGENTRLDVYLNAIWKVSDWKAGDRYNPGLYGTSAISGKKGQVFEVRNLSEEGRVYFSLWESEIPVEVEPAMESFGVVTTDIPTLNFGEVALLSSCSSGDAGSEPGLVYTLFESQPDLGILPAYPKGIKVGPGSIAFVYPNPNYEGTPVGVNDSKIVCYDDGIGSFKFPKPLNFLVVTGSCASCDLEGIDLSKYNLDNSDLSYANLKDSKLGCAKMNSTDMTGANLTNASIDSSDGSCSTTTFESAKLTKADLSSASLTHVLFSGGKMVSTDFSGATLNSVTFSGADCSHISLSGADLEDVLFEGQDLGLEGVDFSSPQVLKNVTLDGNIGCASFHGMDLVSMNTEGKLIIKETCTYGSDYSCRTDFSGATLDLEMFTKCESTSIASSADVATCLGRIRYFNLDSAHLGEDYASVLTSSSEHKLTLSGAILSNLDLSGVTLDYADMSCGDLNNCTDLSGTDLTSSSLKHVKLQGAKMHSANLDKSNLESANLNSASLGMDGDNSASASFTGAYMKNANLSEVNGSGVQFDNVSFYSGTPGKCSSDSWATGDCATAVGASLNNTNFSGAYLNGMDFSEATLTGVTFNGASMMATTFVNTKLGFDKFTGNPTNMDLTLLGGADFRGVGDITGASFESAYGTRTGLVICLLISGGNTDFAGFGDEGNPGYCSTTTQCTSRNPGDWDCIFDAYNSATIWPSNTDNSNICFDGSNGPCDGKWNTDQSPSRNNDLPLDCLPAPQGQSCVRECTIFDSTCTNDDYSDPVW